MAIKVCLIGPIPKGDQERKSWKDWKVGYKAELSRIPNVKFTDGDLWRDETKPMQLVGFDAHLIKTADVIIVNCAERLGAGTAQEIVLAKYFARPVITILPKGTYHRKSNIVFDGKLIEDWIHPFILTFSDLIVEHIDESITWLNEFNKDPKSKQIKDISIIDDAIDSYLDSK